MLRKKPRLSEAHVLPLELLVKVTSYVGDAETLFTFLDALGTADARGPLEPLWQLGRLQKPKHVWPTLRLTKYILEDAACRRHLEAAIQHILYVEVTWVRALEWLCRHVHPPTAIIWSTSLLSPLIRNAPTAWFAKWTNLPLVHLTLFLSPTDHGDIAEAFYAVLPRCTGLTRLELKGSLNLEAILTLAATSTKIVELNLSGSNAPPTVTTAVLGLAMQWLEATNVEALRFCHWNWDATVDKAIRGAFYTALFGCSTMETIVFRSCKLPGIHLTAPFGVRTLSLTDCFVSPSSLRGLAQALPQSYLRELTLEIKRAGGSDDVYLDAFDALFRGLAHSNVKSLSLRRCRLGDSYWLRLAPFLQRSKVEAVDLGHNTIANEGAIWIAQAVAANSSIRTLNLTGNAIETDGAVALLNVNTQRPLLLEEINLLGNAIDSDEESDWLSPLATKRGFTTFNSEPVSHY
ncbi:Aste57867_3912 [Aphanomyces stellatus]|uniref:Aste57867_3912 protein n=1 Tax=Aphanomyces stellatus TaxID=120398 RepID=A0A485KC77_9STRA|nr:hypothetical protein As57867_003901 [Aphanomyces stellatus]VFT81051.1 Aste57867_3912 [Aphanomyces stellatus]